MPNLLFRPARRIRISGQAWLLAMVLNLIACTTALPPTTPGVHPPADTSPGKSGPPEPSKPVTLERQLQAISWAELPGWADDDLQDVSAAWQQNCKVLARPQGRFANSAWLSLCAAAQALASNDRTAWRQFIETHFEPKRIALGAPSAATPLTQGLITGYYEPVYTGSRQPGLAHNTALYMPPNDLITVDLSSLYPELKGQRVRGRLVTQTNSRQQLVPYFSRAEFKQRLEKTPDVFSGRELVWLDPLDAFFIEVQGSGRVTLPDDKQLRVGYADQNGHPYKSIGRWLVDQGELSLEQASMQGIREWAKRNPQRIQEMLNANPSLVFFREMSELKAEEGPIGSMGVPLVAQRTVAVDPKFIALGSLLFLNTTQPNSTQPLQRLVFAQDTGGAIRGAIRADYFWGSGPQAGIQAGSMRQQGELYWLVPKPQ